MTALPKTLLGLKLSPTIKPNTKWTMRILPPVSIAIPSCNSFSISTNEKRTSHNQDILNLLSV